MSVTPIPQTPDELAERLLIGGLTQAYADLAIEAARHGLNEASIGRIEAGILDFLSDDHGFEHELEGFEAELVMRNARATIAAFFIAAREKRAGKLSEVGP